jgi:hypothetical protein
MSMDDGETSARDRRAMAFLWKARGPRGLSPAAIERIEWKLQGRQALDGASGQRRRPRTMLLAAVATAAALLVGGTFALAHVGWRNLPFVGPLFAPRARNGAQAPRHGNVARKAAVAEAASPSDPSPPLPTGTGRAAPPAPAEGEATTNEAPAPIEGKRSVPASRKAMVARGLADGSRPRPPVAAQAAMDPLLGESQSLAAAIERWHRDRDGCGALAALDAHERLFPAGHLLVEARVLRAEILLAQGREGESLMLLDRMTLAGSPRARELFTVRGELRIKLGRCREGRTDLDEVLNKGGADGFAKRAVQALGRCP